MPTSIALLRMNKLTLFTNKKEFMHVKNAVFLTVISCLLFFVFAAFPTSVDAAICPTTRSNLWSKESGPGTVTFGDINDVDTTASFDMAGPYVLKLTASDGVLCSSDTVTVTVLPVVPPGTNVHIRATLDRAPWPASGTDSLVISSNFTSPTCAPITIPWDDHVAPPGSKSVAYCSGGPPNATIDTITPSATQTLAPSGDITFTFNFRSTGNIVINAKRDGVAWTGPEVLAVKQTQNPYGVPPATAVCGDLSSPLPNTIGDVYTGLYEYGYCSGGPPGATLSSITPNPQTLIPGATKTFTFNFVTAPPGIPTLIFSADQTSVPYNTGTTLRWTVNGATSCTAGGDWGPGPVASADGPHSFPTGNLTADKIYTLFCSNTSGDSQPKPQTVTITVQRPTFTVTLIAADQSVPQGTGTTLTWSTTGTPDSCTANSTPATNWTGSRSIAGGSEPTDNLTSATTFTLSCTRASTVETAQVSVTVAMQVLTTPPSGPIFKEIPPNNN